MAGFDFTKASGMGMENIDSSVLGLPFITMIQKGSPEFDETHPKFSKKKIEGCRPGQILFEPERLILRQPTQVVPLAQSAIYTEWKPNKGGFAGNRSLDITQDRNYRKGTPGAPNQYREYLGENELVYTLTFLLLFLHPDGKWHKGIIAFTSTQLKVARDWTRTIYAQKLPNLPADMKPPIFAAKYNLKTFADSNSKGGYFSWLIEPAGLIDPVGEQALLEQSFEEATKSHLMLPKVSEPMALTQGGNVATVVQGDDPY